jgi:hypothetical protein
LQLIRNKKEGGENPADNSKLMVKGMGLKTLF